jgi:hypothetical protein
MARCIASQQATKVSAQVEELSVVKAHIPVASQVGWKSEAGVGSQQS